MAIMHITFNDQLPHGRQLRQGLQIDTNLDMLNNIKDTMALMIDGNGTQEAHFTAYIIAKFGFENATGAKAAWDEINSLLSKLNTNASVTDVNAAIRQLADKLR